MVLQVPPLMVLALAVLTVKLLAKVSCCSLGKLFLPLLAAVIVKLFDLII